MEALAGGSHTRTYDDIDQMIRNKTACIVEYRGEAGEAFIVLEILRYPRHLTLHGAVAGGDLAALHEMEPMMVKIAKVAKCKYMTVAGREGWLRHLKSDGWKHDYVTLYKEVTP
jgi:hypothetical protein